MMKPGDTVECAIWVDGRETPEQRQQFEKDVQIAKGQVRPFTPVRHDGSLAGDETTSRKAA